MNSIIKENELKMCVGKSIQSDFNLLKFGDDYNLLLQLEAAKDTKQKERGRRNDDLMKHEEKKLIISRVHFTFLFFHLKKRKKSMYNCVMSVKYIFFFCKIYLANIYSNLILKKVEFELSLSHGQLLLVM